MPEEIATQTAHAATEESAPSTIETTPAEIVTESAPVETPEETGEKGSEPKAVKELKEQRRKRREAENEAAYWKGMAEGRQPGAAKAVEPEAPRLIEPRLEDFADYDEFRKAERTYLKAVTKQELLDELKSQQKASTQAESAKEVEESFATRLSEARKADSDFDEAFEHVGTRINLAMAEAIKECEAAPQLIRHLHEHPDVLERLTRLSPLSAARELGKIEDRLTSKPAPPKKISQAPEPIKPVSPVGGVLNEDDLPMDDWVKLRNQRQYGRK